jgi:predicted RNase H-like HicB family nuclease
MKYRVTLIEEEEGGWSVWCDDLPGCCSQGETRDEAIDNIRTAIREYLEVVEEDVKKENGVRAILHAEHPENRTKRRRSRV